MMTAHEEAQLAGATLELLKTATVQGAQIPVYVACHNWLQSKVDAANKKEETNAEGS